MHIYEIYEQFITYALTCTFSGDMGPLYMKVHVYIRTIIHVGKYIDTMNTIFS